MNFQQDVKCYNKKAVEAVSLVKGLKKKHKRIGKTRKMRRKGENKMVCQKYTERTFDDRYAYKEVLRMNHTSF